mgnify:FL=1|tara:strand:+ start:54 stop:257 length:204 start_codon:yes stop_codon:yes gene_type:complete
MKYLIIPILFLAGCKSLNNVESVDLDLGGFEVEFYEPPPVTIIYTNAPVATPSKFKLFPTLMEMNTK